MFLCSVGYRVYIQPCVAQISQDPAVQAVEQADGTGNWSLKVPVGMEVLASDRRLESPESAKRMVARYAIC
jgi:hypothetical protein